MKVGLAGRVYKDTKILITKLFLGDTNGVIMPRLSKGGIYNISRNLKQKLDFYKFPQGSNTAIIISELNFSRRTSITYNKKESPSKKINYKKIDWLHIAYIDDLPTSCNIKTDKCPVSIDFCTLQDREDFLPIIDSCELVFDSRERKGLYRNINTKTPIILHDKHGCECIINNKIILSKEIKPKKNLQVNGAGDIFAGFFISNYYNKSLAYAIKKTAGQTKKYITKNEI